MQGIQFLEWPEIFKVHFETIDKKTSKWAKEWLLTECLPSAHLFLLPVQQAGIGNIIRDEILPLDLPFQTCVFECLTDHTIDIELAGEGVSNKLRFNFIGAHEYRPGDYFYFGVAIWENSTGHSKPRAFMVDTQFENRTIGPVSEKSIPMNRHILRAMHFLVKTSLESLNRSDTDVGRYLAPVPKIRARILGEKRVIKIKPITVVRSKKASSPPSDIYRQVDWSHRWEVRGHWRKVVGIGKNREGEYAVKNFTWVKSHTKGPEEAVLVKKIRVVTDAAEESLPARARSS